MKMSDNPSTHVLGVSSLLLLLRTSYHILLTSTKTKEKRLQMSVSSKSRVGLFQGQGRSAGITVLHNGLSR